MTSASIIAVFIMCATLSVIVMYLFMVPCKKCINKSGQINYKFCNIPGTIIEAVVNGGAKKDELICVGEGGNLTSYSGKCKTIIGRAFEDSELIKNNGGEIIKRRVSIYVPF